VIGIVAARLVERFGRPTALIGTQGEEARGSARSAAGWHIADALGVTDSMRYPTSLVLVVPGVLLVVNLLAFFPALAAARARPAVALRTE